MINQFMLCLKCITFLFFLLASLSYCSGQKKLNPELETPDLDTQGNMHGTNYTQLGCLLNAPWEFVKHNMRGPDVSLYLNGTAIPSDKTYYTEFEKKLVFELQKDGTVKYWFKTDYITPPDDTITEAGKTKEITHHVLPSNKLRLKKIYTQGVWIANFKDSTLKIDFGKNTFDLMPIDAKFIRLASMDMVLQETSFMDVIWNGKVENIKKIKTFYFEH